MDLIKITDLTDRFNISSRTLRYYEQVGLLQSVRPPFEKYRYYNEDNINRLQQIIVLRKMQIPIKDIMTIYEHRDTTVLVQSFVNRINSITNEIEALTELKSLINDFLDAMIKNGITHISALPLIYEKVESQFLSDEKKKSITAKRFSDITDKLIKPIDLSIVELEPMRVISSLKKDTHVPDMEAFWNWMSREQIPFGRPGSRTLFEYQNTEGDTVVIQKITYDSKDNSSDFFDYDFLGGLFAVCGSYADDDISKLHQRMIESFDNNMNYEVDYRHDGGLRHETLVESVLSPDNDRDKINLYLPIKKRITNVGNYESIQLLNNITLDEIERANPIVQDYFVDFHKITTIYDPHYKVLENGEAEFNCWISPRMLNTNTMIKIPFRVDIEFLAESKSEAFGYGADEGSLWFSHNNHTYTINGQNNSESSLSKHAIIFNQPVLGSRFVYPKIGDIDHDVYNKLTWIIGEKHFAVIINHEVRYCGVNLPYMNMDLHLQKPDTILLGSNGQGKKLFHSIKVSQLKISPKMMIKKGELSMSINQSNNILPNLHQMITSHYGENYWFNGCAKYVMECLDETNYDYWFFAGLTSDNFVQVYSKNHFRGDGVTDYTLSEKGNHDFIEEIFQNVVMLVVLFP